MKKILIIFLILFLNSGFETCTASDIKNTQAEREAVLNCQKGDKILLYYETKDNQQHPDRYLNAAKYYYYQASNHDLSNADALIGQARIALYQNKMKEAKKILFVALNYNSSNPKTNFYLGETYFRQGEYTHAIEYYNYAYQHGFAKDYKTNYQLGICYEKMNENIKARTHLQIAATLNPNDEEAKKRLEEMDNIKTNLQNFDIMREQKAYEELKESVSIDEIRNLQNLMH